MKKAILKQLSKLSKDLPIFRKPEKCYTPVKGIDLINAGVTKLPDGTKILPGKMYSKIHTVYTKVNHYKELKKQVAKHGPKGIQMYVDAVVKAIKDYEAKALEQQTLTETASSEEVTADNPQTL